MKTNQELTIYKPNELIEITGQPISTNGLLVYNFLLHRFQNEKKDKLIFNPSEIFEELNISDKYEDLYGYLSSLLNVGVHSLDKRGRLWGGFNLLAEYKKVEEGIFVQIPDTIYKAICGNLEDDNNLYYTTIKLLEQRVYRCSHTIIFYELFKKYEKVNLPIFTLKELRLLTGTSKKYSRYVDFKRYVLEKGIKELNKFEKNYEYSFEITKLGKKVDKIKFIKTGKVNRKLAAKDTFSKAIEKAIEKARKNRFIDASYSHRALVVVLSKYDEQDVLKALREAYKYNSEIINFSKFLISKIKDIQNSRKKPSEKIEKPKEEERKNISPEETLRGEIAQILMKSKKYELFNGLENLKTIEELEKFKNKI